MEGGGGALSIGGGEGAICQYSTHTHTLSLDRRIWCQCSISQCQKVFPTLSKTGLGLVS